jgi:hypothetical protein
MGGRERARTRVALWQSDPATTPSHRGRRMRFGFSVAMV